MVKFKVEDGHPVLLRKNDRVTDEADNLGTVLAVREESGMVDVLFDQFGNNPLAATRMPIGKVTRVVDVVEEKEIEETLNTSGASPIKSDGGSSDYYKISVKTSHGMADVEVNDVIYALVGGDFDLGNVLKGTRRMYLASKGCGKEGVDIDYDVNKCHWFLDDFRMRFGDTQ